MFEGATVFNQNIDAGTAPMWNVQNVKTFTSMFKNAQAFNKVITDWVLTDAETLTSMFQGATKFDVPIPDWIPFGGDTTAGKVTDFTSMFEGATEFNQVLNNWRPSAALAETALDRIFYGATKFNQNLCDWNAITFTAVGAGSVISVGTDTFFGTSCQAEYKPNYVGLSANDGSNVNTAQGCFLCG